jgi:predicted transcriptional regulator
MKFDLTKKGLDTVLTPYQKEIMRWIWETGESDSRAAHDHLRTTPHPMSRATTINFLNKMADEGYLTHTETTAKGGRKRIYRPSPTAPHEETFRKALSKRILEKVRNELEGNIITSLKVDVPRLNSKKP